MKFRENCISNEMSRFLCGVLSGILAGTLVFQGFPLYFKKS